MIFLGMASMRATAERRACRALTAIHPTRIIRRARRGASSATTAWTTDMTDRLDRFPYVWCDTCEKIQPMTFDVIAADDRNDHDAADIVCNECSSIIATMHAARR